MVVLPFFVLWFCCCRCCCGWLVGVCLMWLVGFCMGLGGSTAFFACLVGLVVGKGILLGLAYSTYVGQSRAGVIPRGGERGGRGKEELGGVVHLATYLPVRLLLAGIMGCRWFLILRRVGERWRRVRSTFLFLCFSALSSSSHHISVGRRARHRAHYSE